jgi:MFS family permease
MRNDDLPRQALDKRKGNLKQKGRFCAQGWVLWAWIFFQRCWEVVTATAMWMPSFIMIMNTALPEYQGRMQGMAGAVQMSLMAISPTMGGTIWNYTVGKPWPISPHLTYWCIQILTLSMLALACYLPETLNFPKSELLKREAAAVGNGRSLGMTPLARGAKGAARPEKAGSAEGGDDEKEGLLHQADV